MVTTLSTKKIENPKLSCIGSILVPDMNSFTITEDFMFSHNFRRLGKNFKDIFLNTHIKGEGPRKIFVYAINQLLNGRQIRDELATGSLACIIALVENQRNGEKGTLLIDGNANLMVVKNTVMGFYFHSRDEGYWVIEAYPVELNNGGIWNKRHLAFT